MAGPLFARYMWNFRELQRSHGLSLKLFNIHILSPACSHAYKQQGRLSNLSLNGGPGTRTPGAEIAHRLHCRFHCAHASSY